MSLFRPSLSTFLVGLFIAYIGHSIWSMYKIYYPTPCPRNQNCIKPLFDKSSLFRIAVFASTSKKVNSDQKLLWSSEEFNIFKSFDIDFNVSIPKETLRNGSLYLHVFLTDALFSIPISSVFQLDLSKCIYKHAAITKYVIPKSKAFNLLSSQSKDTKRTKDSSVSSNSKPKTHWIPRLSVYIMSEPIALTGFPSEMYAYMKFNKRRQYYPLLFIDHFGILEKDFWPLNRSSQVLPLSISFVPVSFGKMRFMIVIEQTIKMIEVLGFSNKEVEDVKSIFFDTNIYLLILTFAVSGFHLLFDILSFKNDISFWRQRKSNVGISFRSLLWRSISQAIIFLYLYDQGSSLIVLIPMFFSVLIELWKVTKALKMNIFRSGWLFKIEFGLSTDEEKQSDAYDSEGMKYVIYFIFPCCIGYAIYSLLYIEYESWFSWCLETIVNGVYAFGFVFMLPQLFVNYKLKSVAHLPWRAFMYKAFNTVVDDLFAFIITMPTAHRIACFRDDVVFFVYLYQRWLYPVDKKRVTEYSEVKND